MWPVRSLKCSRTSQTHFYFEKTCWEVLIIPLNHTWEADLKVIFLWAGDEFSSPRNSSRVEGGHWGWFHSTVFLVKGQINQRGFLLWSSPGSWSVSMPEPQRSVGIRCHMFFRIEEWRIVACCLCASGCEPAISYLSDRLSWDYNLSPRPHLKRI